MARLMFSAGMFCAFASAMIVRRRGFMSGSPPPARAATVSSLMRRVKTLPRLASAAPFLCLMECHLECPDMAKILPLSGQDDPDIRARVPRPAAIIAEHLVDGEPRAIQPIRHLPHRKRAKRQAEAVLDGATAASLDVPLIENRQTPAGILAHRLDESEAAPAGRAPMKLRAI